MKIKHDNGKVTFVMRAGKDKVRSQMTLWEAERIVSTGENVVNTDTKIIVDDTYFFPAIKEVKPVKNKKAKEVSDNE